MTIKEKAFEYNLGKGENAGNQHFLLFSQCFLLIQRQKSSFGPYLFCHLCNGSSPNFRRLVKS